MHRGSDHLKPVRFLSFYGFVMRRATCSNLTKEQRPRTSDLLRKPVDERNCICNGTSRGTP